MAVITSTVGSAGGRDYSDLSTAEADDFGMSSGDTAIVNMYNDSTFNDSVTINTTVSTGNIQVTAVDSEKHDGTAGNGVRWVHASTGKTIEITREDVDIEWIEWDQSDLTGGARSLYGNSGNVRFKNILFHNIKGTSLIWGMAPFGVDAYAVRCTGYEQETTATGSVENHLFHVKLNINSTGNDIAGAWNCTGYHIFSTDTDPENVIFYSEGATIDDWMARFVNNIGMGADDSDFLFNGSRGFGKYGLSEDATADDAPTQSNNVINKTIGDQFVSTTLGSEDLHIKSGSDAIDVGLDLVNTPAGVKFDINNRDVDAEGDTWDIGAHELVAAVTVPDQTYAPTMQLMQSGGYIGATIR